MPKFEARLETTIGALSKDPPDDPQENEFIDSSRLVYDGVRDIRYVAEFSGGGGGKYLLPSNKPDIKYEFLFRRAVLMLRNPDDVDDSDVEAMMEGEDTMSRLSGKVTCLIWSL